MAAEVLLAAYSYIAKHPELDRAQKKKLRTGSLYGFELVVIAAEIAADLEAALEQFAAIGEDMKS